MTPAERLLSYLTTLATTGQPCPSNDAMAAALGTYRSNISRALRVLDERQMISRRGGTEYRQVRILSGPHAGTETPKPPVRHDTHARKDPGPPPLCATGCGRPVIMASGKYPRSCPDPACRRAVRGLAYGGEDPRTPWPTITGPVAADFAPHNLRLLPITARNPGRPLSTTWGVPGTYDRRSSS
jgi:hypothetical protein